MRQELKAAWSVRFDSVLRNTSIKAVPGVLLKSDERYVVSGHSFLICIA